MIVFFQIAQLCWKEIDTIYNSARTHRRIKCGECRHFWCEKGVLNYFYDLAYKWIRFVS